MKNFFIIGVHDPCFLFAYKVVGLPQFQGIVLPEGESLKDIYSGCQSTIAPCKTFSLPQFVNFARQNADTLLVSFYSFPAGLAFIEALKRMKRCPFEVCDFYDFYYDKDVPVVFTAPRQEREQVLAAKGEWTEFRKQLTDEFSKRSLDCYLEAYETKDRMKMRPVFVMPALHIFNSLSRKFSLVPDLSGEIYVDIGAWDGDTVEPFVNCVESYKAIHAFEPSTNPFARLKEKTFYLRNFHTYQLAVSDTTGYIEFLSDQTVEARAAELGATKSDPIERLPCTKLDDVLDEATILKIEVEGSEPKVIEGAANLIKKRKPDMCVYAYHFALDPLRILEAVNKIHPYKFVALRFSAVAMHAFRLYFSDRGPFA